MKTSASFERLQHLAERQYGVFTVQQAAGVGVDEETLEALRGEGELRRIVEGAYKLRGFRSAHKGSYALWLLLDPAKPAPLRKAPQCGVVSHASAGDWLDSFDSGGLAVTFPVGVDVVDDFGPNADRINIYYADLSEDDWVFHNGLPVTTPARMVMDLLDADKEDETSIGRRLRSLEIAGLTNFEELSSQLDVYAREQGYGSGNLLAKTLRDAARPDSERKRDLAR